MFTGWSLTPAVRTVAPFALGLAALALRLSFAQPEPIFPDSATYLSVSRAVLEGQFATTFRGGVPTFFPPLYPATIALLSRLGPDMETAAVLVSAIAGAAAVLAVWWLARTMFGTLEAWIAALLTAVSPLLVHWSAHMLTESLFAAIAVTAVAAGWRAIGTQSLRWFVLAGLLCGLAYLTRIIGLVLLPAVGMGIFVRRSPPDANPGGRLRLFAAFCLGFLMVSFPYWVHLRGNMGGWTVTGSYRSVSEFIRHGGNPELGEWRQPIGTSASFGPTQKIGRNAVSYTEATLAAASITLAFAVVGLLIRKPRSAGPAIAAKYLASVVGCYLVALLLVGGVPSLAEQIRYVSPMLPFLLILSSHGVTQVANRAGRLRASVIVSVVGVILFSFWVQTFSVPGLYFSSAWMPHPPSPHRTFGLWMRDHLQPPLSIMARKPYIPYFAAGTWYLTPPTLGEIVKLAQDRHVDYLVVDRLSDTGSRPQVAALLDSERAPTSLDLVAVQRIPDGRVMIALYKIKTP